MASKTVNRVVGNGEILPAGGESFVIPRIEPKIIEIDIIGITPLRKRTECLLRCLSP